MTWKLFETLLCKRHSHVSHNLVLRNLTSHAHVDLTSTVHDSQAQHGASAAETNCIDNTTVTTHAASNPVPSQSMLSAPHKCFAENCDALAHGDSGFCLADTNNVHSLASPPVSNNAVDLLKVDAEASLSHGDESQAETDRTGMTDTAAGGDVNISSHALSKSHLSFETQTVASSLASHTISQTLADSREIPIQQVVYV